MTIQIVQDPIIDQYERSIFTFLEMTGQLGGLYEVLAISASFLINKTVNKFFTLSILKNLNFVEYVPHKKEITNIKYKRSNLMRNRLDTNKSEMIDENKSVSFEDNSSSIVEKNQAMSKISK